MAKPKKPEDGFTPTPAFTPDVDLPDDQTEESDAGDGDATEDPRDAELERLRAENAALRAAAGPVYAGGRRYRVSLRDGPTANVQCGPGEHPFEAFKRQTGVLNSVHAPEIHEAADDAPCGLQLPDGSVRPFAG